MAFTLDISNLLDQDYQMPHGFTGKERQVTIGFTKNISMKNIYLFELSDVFANQVYLPYCSGVVWSYVKNNPYIKDNYKLKDWFYARDDAKILLIK